MILQAGELQHDHFAAPIALESTPRWARAAYQDMPALAAECTKHAEAAVNSYLKLYLYELDSLY
jgi:hypothetical protein